tara:strand:- start:271 stop:1182 length:912 start_codon:yes stop_codon:yes gene_type:complete
MTELIEFVSHSLGDNIAWSPYCHEYHKITGSKLIVKTKWAELFDDIGDSVKFVPIENGLPNVLGLDGRYWRDEIKQTGLPKINNLRKIFFHLNRDTPIQKQICDQLNIPYKETRPTISLKGTEQYTTPSSKYVCIAVQSTNQCKLWKEAGWDKIVRLLKKMDYKVLCIDQWNTFGSQELNLLNTIPKKALDKTGSLPMQQRIKQIANCEFFVGLSSGLSWLAWALGKKVVMISGATKELNEFKSNCFRAQNKSVCHGCLNDESLGHLYSPPWEYCPKNKKWECYKSISTEMVKEQILKLKNGC